jgi:hypothetical protein
MGLMICSPKALTRAKEVGRATHYNDILFLEENRRLFQTQMTPNVLGIYLVYRLTQQLPSLSETHRATLAKMKIWSNGKHLWMRMIGSTAVGEALDSSLFYMMAFYAIWPTEQVISVAIAQYFLKTGWEVVMTPVTYRIVSWLKRQEEEDYMDIGTDFTPFRVRV